MCLGCVSHVRLQDMQQPPPYSDSRVKLFLGRGNMLCLEVRVKPELCTALREQFLLCKDVHAKCVPPTAYSVPELC